MKRRRQQIEFTQPTLTQQHSKDEVDINNIMSRYIKTGILDHVSKYQPQYTENRETDYHSAMNIVTRANAMFLDLPSQARAKFNNDPGAFLEYVENPDNHDNLHELGITNKPNNDSEPVNTPAPASTLSDNEPNQPPSDPAPAAPAP